MMSGIYQIRNLTNNKIYIGSARDLKARWRLHKTQLNSNSHHSSYLQNAYNKYEKDNFVFEILFTCSEDYLIRIEQYHINNYKPKYNICQVAGSCLGVKRSDETKAKISSLKIGLRHSNETKAKLSKVKQGTTHSAITRQKLSILSKGRKHTPEAIQKMRVAQLGKVLSTSHLENVRKSREKIMRSVIQYDPVSMIIINEYISMKSAEQLTGIYASNISACVRGLVKTAGKFIWKYKSQTNYR